MIAIVTSCINPKKIPAITRSYFSLQEREEQTIHTLNRLKEVGFKHIILADNSFEYDFTKLGPVIDNVQVVHLKQYQFLNKSINEILILLSILDQIPENTPIFKISGRYFPSANFKMEMSDGVDFKVKGFEFDTSKAVITTRGYFVRNKAIYEDFLLYCLNEIYSYPYRVVGLGSFTKFIKQFLKPSVKKTTTISVEFAAARAIKQGGFTYELTDNMNIEGQIAGLESKELIKE
jgi:hypothetical protein